MNKKALIEKKNELHKHLNALFEDNEEKRSISKEKEDKIKELFNSLSQIDEEIRSLDKQYISENKSQNRKRDLMNKEDKLEIRRNIEAEALAMKAHGKKSSDIVRELASKYEVRTDSVS